MITQEELRIFLTYEAESGVFTWNVKRGSAAKGQRAGKPTLHYSGKTYCYIRIYKRSYAVHRLAWLYVHGYMPEEIDHINGNGADNRIINLREVTHQENSKNVRLNSVNTSGVCGVSFTKKRNKWEAYITEESRKINLGYHGTLLDAVCARKNAEKFYGYHVNHGTDRPL